MLTWALTALALIAAMLMVAVILAGTWLMEMIRGVECIYCQKRIWPWESRGWYVWSDDGSYERWHGRCYVGR